MKISYRWLDRHLDLQGIPPERVAQDLTLSTAEVEGLERFLPHLSDVVVGLVLERERHPDAEKLSFCQVDVGAGLPLGIVCGAPNVAAGQKVAVARVGTTLPGDVKIKKAKIRGLESNGMICSERELGMGDEHDGIWVLAPDARIGADVATALGLDDWVIEIDNKSLTHRPDLWGHRGIAGEIAAMHLRKLKPLHSELPRTGGGPRYPVRIESAACTRYLALAIDGVSGGRSPDWMRALLFAVGQRPIDLLVDVSNFVMLDLGQPNHLFDRARLSPEGIVVREARRRETLRTLDGVERVLLESDLLVCAGDEPVALAGIMGGERSKVAGDTRSLLLEVAHFEPATVRRTSQRLGLRSDASARFEKSLDPNLPLVAAGQLVRILSELQPSLVLPSPLTDEGTWKDPARTITLRGERARALLGVDVSDTEIADILMRLGFGVVRSGEQLFVEVPSARATKDVTLEQDLIEEIGRIHRYGNIPERRLLAEIAPPPRDERRALVRKIQDQLAGGARFHETISYSFVSDELLDRAGLSSLPHVEVQNPVAAGFARIRRSVVPSLLGLVPENRRRYEEVRLFEIGKGYLPERTNARGEPGEAHVLGLVWAAPVPASGARFDAGCLPQLQGVVEDLVRALGRELPSWIPSGAGTAPAWAHPRRALHARAIDEAEPLVTLAALEPGVKRRLGLEGELDCDVAVAEISIDALLAAPERAAGYAPVPKFPGVKVDIAAAAPAELPAATIAAAIEKAGKGTVAATELFDVYSGANLGAGRKSLAWHVELQSDSRTLTDQDVAKFLERVERELAAAGAELRR